MDSLCGARASPAHQPLDQPEKKGYAEHTGRDPDSEVDSVDALVQQERSVVTDQTEEGLDDHHDPEAQDFRQPGEPAEPIGVLFGHT